MKVLFAGGGTAGHINPAIAVAGYIKEKYPNLKIVSGHCTCSKAGDILKSVLDDRYATFCSGYSILL